MATSLECFSMFVAMETVFFKTIETKRLLFCFFIDLSTYSSKGIELAKDY